MCARALRSSARPDGFRPATVTTPPHPTAGIVHRRAEEALRYCPTCRRYVNGALSCPGCGVAATGLPLAAIELPPQPATKARPPAVAPRSVRSAARPTTSRIARPAPHPSAPRSRLVPGRGQRGFPLRRLAFALLIAGLGVAVLCGIAGVGSSPGPTGRSSTGRAMGGGGNGGTTAPTSTASATQPAGAPMAVAEATVAVEAPAALAPSALIAPPVAPAPAPAGTPPLVPSNPAIAGTGQSPAPAPITPTAGASPSPSPSPATSCLLRLLVLCLG